ncbi:MAG: type II secretion system protein [bacterium]
MYLKYKKGFTLIELLVVVSIISLLSSIVLTTLSGTRAKARDAVRKSDMLQIKTALDLYYSDHGSYPLPYPSWWSGVNTGAGVCGSANGTTSGATAYIPGLAPYLPILPVDPIASGVCVGYLYASDGNNYKLLDHGSIESIPSPGSVFYDPARPTWSWMVASRTETPPGNSACAWPPLGTLQSSDNTQINTYYYYWPACW